MIRFIVCFSLVLLSSDKGHAVVPAYPVSDDGRQYQVFSTFGPRMLNNLTTGFNIHEGMDFAGPPEYRGTNKSHPVDVDPVRVLEGGQIVDIGFIQNNPYKGGVIVQVKGEHNFRCSVHIIRLAGKVSPSGDPPVKCRFSAHPVLPFDGF